MSRLPNVKAFKYTFKRRPCKAEDSGVNLLQLSVQLILPLIYTINVY